MALLNYNFYNWVKVFSFSLPPFPFLYLFFCYFMWRNNEKCSTNENIFQMWVYASERATYKILLWIFFNMACFCSAILLSWKVPFEFSSASGLSLIRFVYNLQLIYLNLLSNRNALWRRPNQALCSYIIQ